MEKLFLLQGHTFPPHIFLHNILEEYRIYIHVRLSCSCFPHPESSSLGFFFFSVTSCLDQSLSLLSFHFSSNLDLSDTAYCSFIIPSGLPMVLYILMQIVVWILLVIKVCHFSRPVCSFLSLFWTYFPGSVCDRTANILHYPADPKYWPCDDSHITLLVPYETSIVTTLYFSFVINHCKQGILILLIFTVGWQL